MIKIENLVTPDTAWWDVAINGMRNSYKSNDKHDSSYCYGLFAFPDNKSDLCNKCPFYKINWVNPDDELDYEDECTYYESGGYPTYVLGENDLKLFLNLCKAGISHRKVLRQLPVIMDITAPLYFWKQLDQYKIGTVTNAESTMHTMTKHSFKLEDFSIENYKSLFGSRTEEQLRYLEELVVGDLNDLRDQYLETKNMKYWYALNELLPQSYMQTRTWSANYEVLVNIIEQRKNHKLSEWKDFIDFLLDNVPYLKEIVEDINGKRKNKNTKRTN